MIVRVQEYFGRIYEPRWIQWAFPASVIYATAWWFFLPRDGVFYMLVCAAVGLWFGLLNAILLGVLLAIALRIKVYFLPGDGQERRVGGSGGRRKP